MVGLGYVGLPLAVSLGRHFSCLGFDHKPERVDELKRSFDRTGEVAAEALKETSVEFSSNPADLKGCDIFIITVPTPIDRNNQPDLGPVLAACKTVGGHLDKGDVVVLESTVYPGVTEGKCGPLLEKVSGLKAGKDFFLGYSPERVNPGDREHAVERVVKVIAAQTEEVVELLAELYGAVTAGGVFCARNIKTAEASKAIENAQRDINIAFINEAAIIFKKAGLSIYDVLETASTKWNFLNFKPGLVGGHCIGVDPYYLAHYAEEVGGDADLILTARRINNAMGLFVANEIASRLKPKARVLVMGLTFKENVPDLRNSRSADVVKALREKGFSVDVYDPVADAQEALDEYGIELLAELPLKAKPPAYDAVIGLVAHKAFFALSDEDFPKLVEKDGLVADIKAIWRGRKLSAALRRWEL